jgi:hypothetical protein
MPGRPPPNPRKRQTENRRFRNRDSPRPVKIALAPWIINAVTTLAERNGLTLGEFAAFLIESGLNERGYFRKDFETEALRRRTEEVKKRDQAEAEGLLYFPWNLSGKLVYLGKCKIIPIWRHF